MATWSLVSEATFCDRETGVDYAWTAGLSQAVPRKGKLIPSGSKVLEFYCRLSREICEMAVLNVRDALSPNQ